MQIPRRFVWIAFTAFVAVQASLLCAALVHAQAPAPRAPSAGADSLLTLDRIFGSGEFAAHHVSSIRWTADGKGYTELEPGTGAHGGRDLVRYDVASGKREVVVSAERLLMPGGDTPIEIEGYQWSADGKRLLIFTNAQRVWREDTRGDYWVIDVASGPPRKLGGLAAAPSTLMFAKFSPDGGRSRIRAREQSLRGRRDDRRDHAAHDRWLAHDHQRHLRLGVRGRAQPPRWLSLEPGRNAHRVLAARRLRRRETFCSSTTRIRSTRIRSPCSIRRPAPRTPPRAWAW